jgi:mannitol-1-/sugar-/sorbitol-6-phosphatase
MNNPNKHYSKTSVFDVDAVLFDLDGVLVHSTASIERAWKLWAIKRNLPWSAVLPHVHGRLARDTIRALLPDLSPASIVDDVAEVIDCQVLDTSDVLAVSGVAEFISSIPASGWAIVTGCSPELAASRLTAVGLPQPSIIVTNQDVRAGKPDPEGYRIAAERLRIKPNRCLVVEDSPPGIVAAQRAGMAVVAFTTTHEVASLGHPDAIVADATQLNVGNGRSSRFIVTASRSNSERSVSPP